MSWTLNDRQKARHERETPPPPPTFNDNVPLPSMGWMSLDDDDAVPPGLGALRTVSEAQGMWSTQQLDAFRTLMYRGIEPIRDDPAPGDGPRESGHVLPTKRGSWFNALRRVLPGNTAPVQDDPDPDTTPGPQWRSGHEPPPGYRG